MPHVALIETYHLWEEDEICICPVSHAYNVLTELLANLKGLILIYKSLRRMLSFQNTGIMGFVIWVRQCRGSPNPLFAFSSVTYLLTYTNDLLLLILISS